MSNYITTKVDFAKCPDGTVFIKSNYCPICGTALITAEEYDNQQCELCKLAIDQLVEKKIGGRG